MIVVLFLIISICLMFIFVESIELWCKLIRRIFRIDVSTTFFHLVVVWLRIRRWATIELFSTTYKTWRWSRRMFKSEYILTKIWSCNKFTKSRTKVMTYSQNRIFFSWRHNENIEKAIVFDTNSTSERVIAYCSEDNTLQSMIVWVNDVKTKDWRRFTLMTTIILRWYFQKKNFSEWW
jgi:hypothetical protein